MFDSVRDLVKIFGIKCCPPRIHEVIWHPPLCGWIKCNTDGHSKASSGVELVVYCLGIIKGFCVALLCDKLVLNLF